jgi:hypothetical protein
MAQKADVEQTFEAAELGVPTCYVEDDSIEEVVQEQRQQISLGNGGYITCARAMSDDL